MVDYLIPLVIVAETTPKLIESHDWLPTIGAIIISILTGLFSWWKNRPKEKSDSFKVFMDESSEFREEIRKERSQLKKDLNEAQMERITLQQKLADYEKHIDECSLLVKKQKNELENVQLQLIDLQDNRKYRAILDHLPHIVWTADKNGNVNYYNARGYQYANATYAVGRDIGYLKLFHPDDLDDFMVIWKKCVERGEPYFYEYRLRRGYDGMYRWHIGMAYPRIDNRGEISEWVGSVTDIHDYKTGLIPHRGLEFEPKFEKNAEELEQARLQIEKMEEKTRLLKEELQGNKE